MQISDYKEECSVSVKWSAVRFLKNFSFFFAVSKLIGLSKELVNLFLSMCDTILLIKALNFLIGFIYSFIITLYDWRENIDFLFAYH